MNEFNVYFINIKNKNHSATVEQDLNYAVNVTGLTTVAERALPAHRPEKKAATLPGYLPSLSEQHAAEQCGPVTLPRPRGRSCPAHDLTAQIRLILLWLRSQSDNAV